MTLETAFVKLEDAFTPAELDHIEAHGDAMLLHKAQIAAQGGDNSHIRVTRVAWLDYDAQTAALYEKLGQIVRHINERCYQFDIDGLENLQYTVYRDAEQGHYNWHIDYGAKNPRPRKISLSLQLSDEAGYDGCDLEFQAGHKIGAAPRKRGTLVAFPAFFLHRVTPITRGTRKSLVCWAQGPAFR